MRILKLGFEEICRAIDKEKGLSDVLLAVMELQGRVIDNEPRGEAEIVITDLSRSRNASVFLLCPTKSFDGVFVTLRMIDLRLIH